MLGKLLVGLVGGLPVAALAYLAIGVFFPPGVPTLERVMGPPLLLGLWGLALLIALLAQYPARARRFLYLFAAAAALVLSFAAYTADEVMGLAEPYSAVQRTLTPLVGLRYAGRVVDLAQALGGVWLGVGLLVLAITFGLLSLRIGRRVEGLAHVAGSAVPEPDVANVITAKNGTLTYRVMAYRTLEESELMDIVWKALKDGRLQEPAPGDEAVLVTRIGWDDR